MIFGGNNSHYPMKYGICALEVGVLRRCIFIQEKNIDLQYSRTYTAQTIKLCFKSLYNIFFWLDIYKSVAGAP